MDEEIIQEARKLNPSTLIEVFELDTIDLGFDLTLRFYNGRNMPGAQNAATPPTGIAPFQGGVIEWQGVQYQPLPVEATGYEQSLDGRPARPKLSFANNASTGYNIYSGFLVRYNDFIGAKITRKRTFLKYLDANNFPDAAYMTANGIVPDPNKYLPSEVFYIQQKVSEDKNLVEFDLSSLIEMDGIVLPSRQITGSTCMWKYRGFGCGYIGPPRSKRNGDKFSQTIVEDASKNKGEYVDQMNYSVDEYVYVWEKVYSASNNSRNRKIFFVCKQAVTGVAAGQTNEAAPPNAAFWDIDECPRTQGGSGCSCRFKKGALPFGGFPGTGRYAFS